VTFHARRLNLSRYGVLNQTVAANTTAEAAVVTWHVLQGFLANLPQLDSQIKTKTFNLWTESYGGHYGPAFFSYFEDQNKAIANGTQNGTQLIMDTLGIGNGIIDSQIQTPYYPEFAVNNTYGIKAVNDSVYLDMKAAYYNPGMCRDQIVACDAANHSSVEGLAICVNATNTCRGFVEGTYYEFSGRGIYDIRHPYLDPTPPNYFTDYLNLAQVQQALGVNLNYTSDSSTVVGLDFQRTGDYVYPSFIQDLETLLNNNVRVALYYGDADYICNVTMPSLSS
jgi:carboxypeptidase C (cathepsin A)